mgnify:CR=1 FL=1
MEKIVDKVVLMCCQLGDLWIDGDFESRQDLQKLVFPNGILLDKENCNYWTENENEVFKIMRLFSSTYSDNKEKTTNDFHHLSRSLLQGVDFPYKLSNKFIEDFERIIEFLKHNSTNQLL